MWCTAGDTDKHAPSRNIMNTQFLSLGLIPPLPSPQHAPVTKKKPRECTSAMLFTVISTLFKQANLHSSRFSCSREIDSGCQLGTHIVQYIVLLAKNALMKLMMVLKASLTTTKNMVFTR
jgi:hypothetical protein